MHILRCLLGVLLDRYNRSAMTSNFFALAAKRDYTKMATGGWVIHRLLKPITFEMKASQALLFRVRQQYMRELYEREWEQERLELKRLKLIPRHGYAGFCCTTPGNHRRAA
ncbi:hypothetical protein KR222_008476 [Zaprionus bogoriensis]|nr:hypothetical protein KR222_008476 [Zaprionus bogoriensis]